MILYFAVLILNSNLFSFPCNSIKKDIQLITACKQGNLKKVKKSIEQGASPEHLVNGESPLIVAIQNDYFNIAHYLLEHKKDLINTEDNFGNTPLSTAASWGHTHFFEFLMTQGADVNYIGKGSYTQSPLGWCCTHGNQQGASILLQHGANIELANHQGSTPLLLAIHRRCSALIHMLLAKHAKTSSQDQWGWTPLLHAITFDLDIPDIAALATPDVINLTTFTTSTTPLIRACEKVNLAAVVILINKGAYVDIKNNLGHTAQDIVPHMPSHDHYLKYQLIQLCLHDSNAAHTKDLIVL